FPELKARVGAGRGRMGFYSFLQDFGDPLATLIAGGIGFYGVIQTLKLNAQQVEATRQAERDEEAASVRAVLRGELLVIYEELSSIRFVIDDRTAGGIESVISPYSSEELCRGYYEMLPKLKLLTEPEINVVVKAYSLFEGGAKMCARLE